MNQDQAIKTAEKVYAAIDVVHVCDNMSYSYSEGLIIVELDGGGVVEIFELLATDPKPIDLWDIVENGGRSPSYEKMHPASHRNIYFAE